MEVEDGFGLSEKTVYAPGDKVFRIESSSIPTLRLGPGIRKEGDDLIATKVGILHYNLPGTFFLESAEDTYSAAGNDDVVGVIVKRRAQEVSEQYYVVDIGKNLERQRGALPVLAFKGATKRYRPNLQKGDLVYCRIKRITQSGPVRLTCTNASGQGYWGPLRRTGGLYRASLAFVRRCLTDGSPEHSMLSQVGAKIPLESAIGVNGRIWFYTGYEKSQNLIYSLFRQVEAVNGNAEKIKQITGNILQQITTISDDIPLEDNTQYWITRVA